MTERATAYRALHGGLVLKVEAPHSGILTPQNGDAGSTSWRFTVYAPWGEAATECDALALAAGGTELALQAVGQIVEQLYAVAAGHWPGVIAAAIEEARE